MLHNRVVYSRRIDEVLANAVDCGKDILKTNSQQSNVPSGSNTVGQLMNKLVPVLETVLANQALPDTEVVLIQLEILLQCLQRGLHLVQELCAMKRLAYIFRAPTISGWLKEFCTNLSTVLRAIAALLLNPRLAAVHGMKERVMDIAQECAKRTFPVQQELERFFTECRKIVTKLYNKSLDWQTARDTLKKKFEVATGSKMRPEDVKEAALQLQQNLHGARVEKEEMEEYYLKQIIKMIADQETKPEFLCPVSLGLMSDPVILIETGIAYDKSSILEWFDYGHCTCPVTRCRLKTKEYVEVPILKSLIDEWKRDHQDHLCVENMVQILHKSAQDSYTGDSPNCASLNRVWHGARRHSSATESQATTPSHASGHDEFEEHVPPSETDSLASKSDHTEDASQFGMLDFDLDEDTGDILPQMDGAFSCICDTIKSDDSAALKEIRDTGRYNFNEMHVAGYSLLHFAAIHGSCTCLEFLLRRGANPNQCTEESFETPLFIAARNGHENVMRKLLAFQANITVVNKGGWSPVHVAAHKGHAEVLQLCLEHAKRKGLQTAPTAKGWTTLHHAAYSGSQKTLRLALDFKRGACVVNQTSSLGFSPLHVAAARKNQEGVRSLLADGARVDVQSRNGWTALHFAQESNDGDIAQLLIQHGANPNLASEKEGFTPLHRAAILNHVEFVEVLLNVEGINVIKPSKLSKKTAAQFAQKHGHMHLYRRLSKREPTRRIPFMRRKSSG